MFQLKQYLTEVGVDFIESGVNVKQGDLEINCPFCKKDGNPDPSFHMGINKKTHAFACWRNESHKGKSLVKLVALLSDCSYKKAKQILGFTDDIILDGESFKEIAQNVDTLFQVATPIDKNKTKKLQFPKTFRSLVEGVPSKRYLDYLTSRKFDEHTLDQLVRLYDLRYAVSGRYSNRIIFPIYFNHKLVAWTGRSIFKDSKLRYDTLSTDLGATENVKDLVYNYDELIETSGEILFVVEGPFDMLKLDFLARKMNCRATCLFSKYLSAKRLHLLYKLSKNFKSLVYLLDKGEMATSMRFEAESSFIETTSQSKVVFAELPSGFDDPGELQPYGVRSLVQSLR